MASLPNSKIVSYEEWIHMPEVEGREEVIDGVIHIMPSPIVKHARVVQRLFVSILPQVNPVEVEIFVAQFDLVIRRQPLTVRVPDLALFRAGTIVERDGRIHSAPQLVVEVLSRSNTRREREEKLRDYAGIGVREVWLLDHESRAAEVFWLEAEQLRSRAILSEGILVPREFPDVQVDIAQIWPE